jgi:ketosteroid isomerase-like protein
MPLTTSLEHPNVALIRRAYRAFGQGDLETLGSLFTADAVWHSPGRHPLAGDYRGLDAILGFLGRLMQPVGGTFTPAVRDILASDRHVVVLQQAIGSRNGTQLDTSECVVFTIRDGRIAEVRSHFFDLAALEAFWA